MAGTATHGMFSALEYTTDGGTTYLPVGGIVDVNLDQSVATVNTTDKDSGADEEFIPGHITRTGSGSGNYESDDTGQAYLYAALPNGSDAGTVVSLRWRAQVGVGYNEDEFDAYITSWNAAGPNTDKATLSFDFQVTGAVTSAIQV